jgi:hypothetical protein
MDGLSGGQIDGETRYTYKQADRWENRHVYTLIDKQTD